MRWTKEELDRYHRQMILPQVGPEGQERLKRASVVVVGAGGLGVPVLQYLVAAGGGRVAAVSDRVPGAPPSPRNWPRKASSSAR